MRRRYPLAVAVARRPSAAPATASTSSGGAAVPTCSRCCDSLPWKTKPGFSQIGPRDPSDPRNALYKEFIRICRTVRARAFRAAACASRERHACFGDAACEPCGDIFLDGYRRTLGQASGDRCKQKRARQPVQRRFANVTIAVKNKEILDNGNALKFV